MLIMTELDHQLPSSTPMRSTTSPIGYARAHRSRFITELKDCIRYASISVQPKYAQDLQKCAVWLAEHLRSVGLEHVKVIRTKCHPIVYAKSKHKPGHPTVLIYGHYDVQPVDPISEWKSPPFHPVVRGSNLYGRGACDDKGQLFTHVKALECYLKTVGELPVIVKCLFEGEEEIGSPNLPDFLARHRWDLGAEVTVISDMPILASDRLAITHALRGAISLELEVMGPQQDLHSGIFGGSVHNPLQVLCEIIGRLHGKDGSVAIPGFYDQVRVWSDRERNYMSQTGPTEAELLRNAQVDQGWGEPHFTAYERTTIRPSLSVNGIVGGYQGNGPKAVIPAKALAKLSFRLVPDQDPQEIAGLFRQYVAAIAPPAVHTSVRTQFLAPAALLPRDHPAMQAAVIAYRHGFGRKPVFLRSGGTIPVVNLLYETLHIPTVLMGFALPDDRMHGPNEKFYLPNFFNGITTSICFLSEVASRLKSLRFPQNLALQAQEFCCDH
jgi:acetylornithine deacetylase/succinyl-diaminopimelate desuccinylase-like protein